ncbi:triggering receptor expressed on myeloid cells 1-like isoform X1 [Apodemus sylvaticus]|uniref:triggering receptor expressed on myeloid cells 1-like isoform X1 n=1 Tax=Apodemus sylvaticus TaxID=10129 RepID=UPI0022437138|nr:triggering receptor expressed on myeloid cells 1-like isoform X1 [Apodemus sylvaticus]
MAWEATYLLSPVMLLLLASGSCAQDPEILQTVEGKTVSVTCRYDPRYISHEKIWCKEILENFCKLPVWHDSTGAKKLRFSIQSSLYNSFTVTMTELKMSDSGIYHCGIIGDPGNVTALNTIYLVVSKGSSDVFTPDIIPTTRLPELPILIITKHSTSDTTTTQFLTKPTAVVSSPDPGVTIINGTDAVRSSISTVIVPMVYGLLSKTLVFTVLFIVTQRSFR